jgi:flagellar basal body-associated protein FliL
MKFDDKKAQGRSFWIIVTAIIALVVVVLVILWFSKGGGKAFGEVEGKIEGLQDTDEDGVANMFDKCENTPKGAEVGVDGCPEGEKIT